MTEFNMVIVIIAVCVIVLKWEIYNLSKRLDFKDKEFTYAIKWVGNKVFKLEEEHNKNNIIHKD